MPNSNNPFGMRPIRCRNGGHVSINEYIVPNGTTVTKTIGIGSIVMPNTTATTTGMRSVKDHDYADGTKITGVCVGLEDQPSVSLNASNNRVTGTLTADRKLRICDDENAIFIIQEDGTTPITAAQYGLNAMVEYGAPSSVTGVSADVLDSNTDPPAADVSNHLFLLGLHNRPGNAIGQYAVHEVMIANHAYANEGMLGA